MSKKRKNKSTIAKDILEVIFFVMISYIIINGTDLFNIIFSSPSDIKEEALDLKDEKKSLKKTGKIYLYDKQYQEKLIKKLYGNNLNTPNYYHLKDNIKIDTTESQRNLGICSIFATIKAVETNISLLENQSYNFSERYLDYISSKELYGNRTVGKLNEEQGDGMSYSEVIEYIEQYGLALEEDIPYRDYNVNEYNSIRNAKRTKTIDEYVIFSSPNEENDKYYWMDIIKKHITKYGGIIANINFHENLYDEKNNSFYNNGSSNESSEENTGHAIVIVGWDDNYSKEKFINEPNNNGAFIAYNSWSSDWGDNGYFYISYEDIDIFEYLYGIISTKQYYEKKPYFSNQEIPTYDKILYEEKNPSIQGNASVWYYAYILNKDENYPQINEINIYSDDLTEISIYINPYNNDINNLKNFINVGKINVDETKYHKLSFEEPINIIGDEFVVILKYTTHSYRMYYHEEPNADNIYVFKNFQWEKTNKIPYFNIYGYKIW